MKTFKIPFISFLISQLLFLCNSYAAEKEVVIVFNKAVPQFHFAASEIKREMQHAGFSMTEMSIDKLKQVNTPLQIIITTIN